MQVSETVQGIGFGLLVYTVSYAGFIPALNILPSPPDDRPGRQPAMIAAHVTALQDVQVAALGCVEQDSGRDMLPGLVAARLGWEFFSHVVSFRVDDHRAHLRQVFDGGTREIDVALPVCVSADDSCPIGNDPSDEYDLIEKLEHRRARKVTAAELGVPATDARRPEFHAPPERQPRPVAASGPEVIARVAEMLRRFQG